MPVVENFISVLGWEVKKNYPKGWSETLQVRYGYKLIREKKQKNKKAITRKIKVIYKIRLKTDIKKVNE